MEHYFTMINNSNPHSFGFMASLGFCNWSIEDISFCLSGLGYSTVEWTLAHFNPYHDPADLISLVRIPENNGLAVSEVVIQQDLVTLDPGKYQERIEFISVSIQAAAKIGISTLNLFTGPAPWDSKAPLLGSGIQEGEAWKLVLGAFNQLVPLAEKAHVYLAVEAVFGHLCHDYYTLRELIDQYDSEYLAINFDPSHFQLYGNDVPWVIEKLGSRIRHVHLKDVVGRPGMVGREFAFPMLGEGTIDWHEFMVALDKIGYQGSMSVEYEAFNYYRQVLKQDPRRAAAISMEQIKTLFSEE
jgi:sugar phosphate isomerase/epimerase